MHAFTTYELIMTLASIIGWTVAIMQFGFSIRTKAIIAELKTAIKAAITEHKLECIQGKEG